MYLFCSYMHFLHRYVRIYTNNYFCEDGALFDHEFDQSLNPPVTNLLNSYLRSWLAMSVKLFHVKPYNI